MLRRDWADGNNAAIPHCNIARKRAGPEISGPALNAIFLARSPLREATEIRSR